MKPAAWLAGGAVALVLVMGAGMSAALGTQGPSTLGGFDPSQNALADIPSAALAIYRDAADQQGIDWTIVAGIVKVESDHGRSQAAGVHSGVNFAGCCAGPCQFNIRNGPPSTWDTYGAGGNVYDLADCAPGTARMLKANGAPQDYHRAILAYNHSEAYVADVLHWATVYRGAQATGAVAPPTVDASASAVLSNPRITFTHPCAIADIPHEDPRVVALLDWLGQHHSLIITAVSCDHHPGTNHRPVPAAPGRAVDIGSVDGEICRETFGAVNWSSNCSRLARELAAITGPLRPTELIWCADPDGPSDPRGFARADHCDHVHAGWDA